ncbi:hypothetical protein [Bifidobacterium leontopitheci]|uniref:Uncharacterized protein n=1 Tax=Bifidobacterium leontopitheci TaxID=2650774 RepID=A0A6I1GI30_9BIFI|nr:hypothetical protein [Bifidobacterium leontopitheci]KAB7791313.1 hypothetical protein F7D09_0266 [Bifidobacterium leontopitheci]
MFDADKVRKIIAERNETDNEWDDRLEQCWDDLANVLAEDIPGTIHFLLHDCTDNELSVISEVMDQLIAATQSVPLIKAYRTAIVLHPKEAERFYLDRNLDSDIDMLADESEARRLILWRPTAEEIERLRHLQE